MSTYKNPEKHQQLPEISRRYLLYLAEKLRQGFTGQFVIEAHQGGIRELKENKKVTPSDLDE